jgi:hypothetical protein
MICRKKVIMKTPTRLSILLSLLFACSTVISAQTPRKFKTTYKIAMYSQPDFHSSKVTDIPANMILLALEETERYGGYIKVTHKNKTGWVLKAETERYMDVPAPELACWSNGYKIIGNIYRYFFVLRNDGTLAYAGEITLRLFDGEGKVIFEKTVSFSDGPIQPGTGGNFPVDTAVEAPRFELQHKDGTIKGNTGKLIERL